MMNSALAYKNISELERLENRTCLALLLLRSTVQVAKVPEATCGLLLPLFVNDFRCHCSSTSLHTNLGENRWWHKCYRCSRDCTQTLKYNKFNEINPEK